MLGIARDRRPPGPAPPAAAEAYPARSHIPGFRDGRRATPWRCLPCHPAIPPLLALLLLLTPTPASPRPPASTDPDEFVVLVSRKLRVEKIEIRDLQRLFLSVSQTLGEKKVRPVNHTDRAVTLRFLRRITGMTSQEIEEHFVQLELHDEGEWPPRAQSVAQLIRQIGKSPSLVGWLTVGEFSRLSPSELTKVRAFPVGDGSRRQLRPISPPVDIWILHGGKNKRDRDRLREALDSDLKVKAYNVDLFAIADSTGRGKVVDKLKEAPLIILLKEVPDETLQGIRLGAHLLQVNCAQRSLIVEGRTIQVLGSQSAPSSLERPAWTRTVDTKGDLEELEKLRDHDVVLVREESLELREAVSFLAKRLLATATP